MNQPSTWGRRRLLQLGAAALGGSGLGWTGAATLLPGPEAVEAQPRTASALGVPPGKQTVAFRGAHQPGIDTPAQAHLSLLGLDLDPRGGPDALVRLMRLLSDDVRRLSVGRGALADTEPELAADPARLSVTFGFGPAVSRRYLKAPEARVSPLPGFRTDRLQDRWAQTDLAIQICGDDPLTVAHARRMLLKDCRGLATTRWIQNGFRRARGTEPDGTTMRNVMGQVDGTVNPNPADPDFAGLIWSAEGAFTGGTFMVVRRIRAELEAWDRVDRSGREAAVGRRLDNGAPLTGTKEFDTADFEVKDKLGFPVIDPASHIARARSADPGERILRRAYNYTDPDPDRVTGEDSGLVFIAFAADLDRQFVPIQKRLAEQDRLNEWVTTIGSAVYAVPPGASENRFVGQDLLEA